MIISHVQDAAPSLGLLKANEVTALAAHRAAVREHDFVTQWVAYGASRTDAPAGFHHLTALVLLATAIDRNRWLDLQHKRIYPSIYGLCLAGSGQRKSTALGLAQAAALSALRDRRLSNEYSPEAFIEALSLRTPSRGTAFVDEAGRLLATMRRYGYGEGLKDLLAQAWDAPEEFSRVLRKDEFTLRSVYINLVMATTVTRFLETMTLEDVQSGFLARFLPVLATEPVVRRPLGMLLPDTEERARQLTDRLAEVRALLKPGPIPVTNEAIARLDEAEQVLEEWVRREYHADLLMPWVRRLSEYGARLSVIYTVSEALEVLDLPQVLRALHLIDHAKEDVRMLVEELTKDESTRELDKVARFIWANPGISGRDLQRRTKMPAKRVEKLTQELERQDRIAIERDGARARHYPLTTPDVTVSPVTFVPQEPSPGAAGDKVTG